MLNITGYSLFSNKKEIITIDELKTTEGNKINLISGNDLGKTLFLKSLHGEYRKFKGEVKIREKSAKYLLKRKKTILLSGAPHIIPQTSVWNNIVLPFSKISQRQKQKITDLVKMTSLSDKTTLKAKNLSYSSLKFIELIRAVVQMPYLILLDDFDTYFDRQNRSVALKICEYALDNGAILLASSRERLEGFDEFYRIINNRLEKL